MFEHHVLYSSCIDSIIDGSKVEVVLAKPVDKNEYNQKAAKPKGIAQVSYTYMIIVSHIDLS